MTSCRCKSGLGKIVRKRFRILGNNDEMPFERVMVYRRCVATWSQLQDDSNRMASGNENLGILK
jgi:hypothetical protein